MQHLLVYIEILLHGLPPGPYVQPTYQYYEYCTIENCSIYTELCSHKRSYVVTIHLFVDIDCLLKFYTEALEDHPTSSYILGTGIRF